MKGIIHRFDEQLEYSAKLSDEPAWVEFYKRLWPDLHLAIRIDGESQMQRDGIDREIILRNGRRFRVDEKKRKKDYGDLLLEEWSVFRGDGHPGNKIGWALDAEKRCDFIAYAIPPAHKCYFLPFELLRQAFRANRTAWLKARGNPKDAPNDGYVTRNLAVPWATLKTAMLQQMLRRFDAMTLDLPSPIRNGQQLEFDW